MENEEKKNKRKAIIKYGLSILGVSALIGFALKEKSRADKLEGEIKNLRESYDGAMKTIKIQGHALGKLSILKENF